MKKICNHLKNIYQNEIKIGNSIVEIDKWGEYMTVIFKNKGASYELGPDVSASVYKDYHFPCTYDITCKKCKCGFSFPVEERFPYYERNKFSEICDDDSVIATPENVEISDDRWDNWGGNLKIPKFVGFKDRYDENT